MSIKIGFWENRPIENSESLWDIMKESFLCKLEMIQDKLNPLILENVDNKCLLCCENDTKNNIIYKTDEFEWPGSFMHYLEKHNVAIDERFLSYIMRYDITKGY